MKYRHDSEDLLQESFIRIYKALQSYDHQKGQFYTWAKRITINCCLESLRKKKLSLDFDQIIDFVDKKDINPNAIDRLNLQDLTKLIMTLPKGYRTVFNMYTIDGYKHREIAEELKISENTSKTQLMKAKKLLQEKINQNQPTLVGRYA